jgi:CysZ protein
MGYGNPLKAAQYLYQGAHLLCQPGLRRFVIVPLLVNIVVFIVITSIMINTYGGLINEAMNSSKWLAALAWLLWLFIGLFVLVIYGYTFNIITTFIAAPFYGILAEKIETKLTGSSLPEEPIAALLVRTFKRELLKLWYFISRGLLVLIVLIALFFIPLLGNLTGLVISAAWAAWCMTVQYTDYAADNHQIAFTDMRQELRARPLTTYSLGGLVMAGSMIPIVNIFMMPVAVAGATVYWTDMQHAHTNY